METFINKDGFEWTPDHIMNDLIKDDSKGAILDMKCYIVSKDNKPISRVLVDKYSNIIYDNSKLEDMACKIEWYKIATMYNKF